MKYCDIKKMTSSELCENIVQNKKLLLSCRINKKLGQFSNTSIVRKSRRDVARMMMAINQIKGESGNAS